MSRKIIVFSFVFAVALFGLYLASGRSWGLILKTFSDVFGAKQESGPALEISLDKKESEPLLKEEENSTSIFSEKLPENIIGAKAEKNIYPTAAVNILISEILYDAKGSDEGKEFVELYNAGTGDIDLSGWSIKKDGATLVSVGSKNTDKKIIRSGGFFLIGLNNYNGTPSADVVRSFSLPNVAAKIELYGADGVLADSVSYNNSVKAGESYERVSWNELKFLPQPIPGPQNSGWQ